MAVRAKGAFCYNEPVMTKKNVYIIAGPNGAGKTTFAQEFLPKYAECTNFVNADLIAQGIAPFSPEKAGLRAGKLLLEEIRRLAASGQDFGFETTLAGKTYVTLLKDLISTGYRIHLFFLWIPSVDLALLRVKQRVALGGHSIPEPDVRRRFKRGLTNLFKVYKPLLDAWYLFDNSTTKPALIAKDEDGSVTVKDQALFDKILKETK